MAPLAGCWGVQAGFVEQTAAPGGFNVTATRQGHALALAWNTVAGALFYNVYCGVAEDELLCVAERVTDLGYTVNSLGSQAYFVMVIADLSPRRSIASALLKAAPSVGSFCYSTLVNGQGTPTQSNITIPPDPASYGFYIPLDWSGPCIVNVACSVGFQGNLPVVVQHANIPAAANDARDVIITIQGNSGSNLFIVQSQPAATSGDPIESIHPDPSGTTVIHLRFISNGSGGFTAQVLP